MIRAFGYEGMLDPIIMSTDPNPNPNPERP